MAAAERVVLLDFDGTLARREGMWGGCVHEALTALDPEHEVTLEAIRAGLRGGFPWHRPDEPHLDLADPDAWWAGVERLVARALLAAGVAAGLTERTAASIRARFIDPAFGWSVFDDTVPSLERLRAAGWRCVVLSNHVPELSELVAGLGLADHLDLVLTSARLGYEKPHPEAFRLALAAAGHPEIAWMVGDNPVADVRGATALGLPAILVRTPGKAEHQAADLLGAADIILNAAG